VIRRAALAIACGAALFVAGCGGGGESTPPALTGPDPATLAPADAPFFAESVVRPEGEAKDELQSALSKLLATDDPGGFIVDRLDRSLAESHTGLSYEKDIAPWLGERAGAFLETFTNNSDGAFVVATTDAGAAQEAIDAAAAADKKPERKRTYKGVKYLFQPQDDSAVGIVGAFLVAGSETGFRDAVDASKGSSLADSSGFKAQFAAAPAGQMAFAYADPRGIVSALERSGQLSPAQVKAAGPQIQALLSAPATASVSATSDQVSLDASAAASSSAPAPQESALLGSFPDDAWIAFAAKDAGPAYGQALAQAAGGSVAQALRFDLGSQLADWAGDVGGFVRGTSLFGIGGALVVETRDEQASAHTLGELQGALSRNPSLTVSPLGSGGEQGFSLSPAGAPIQIQVVQRDGKVVAGLSDSVDQVFSPSSSLADSDAFKSATDALGGDFSPVAFLDFGPMVQLVDGFPQAASSAGWQQAKPYLDHLDYVIFGGQSQGDRQTVRMVLGLQASSSSGSVQGGSPAAVSPPAP
jgi:hypothetical protein